MDSPFHSTAVCSFIQPVVLLHYSYHSFYIDWWRPPSVSYFIQYHILRMHQEFKTKDRWFHYKAHYDDLMLHHRLGGWYKQTLRPSKQDCASMATHLMDKTPDEILSSFPSRFDILVDGYTSLNRYIISLFQVCYRHEFRSLYNFYVLSLPRLFQVLSQLTVI